MSTVRKLDGLNQKTKVPYNLTAQSLVKLVKLALHGSDICLFE
jgi:hypothetical protein